MAEYWYNGLNHRIGWHNDVTDGAGGGPDGTVDADDPKYFFVYDDQWRVIATYRKEDGQAIDSNPKEWFVYHAAGLDGYGGSSYIDATAPTIATSTRAAPPPAMGGGTLEQRRYYCQNWRADVVAVLTEAGVQDERVAYSAYGVPFGMPAGDTDCDGDYDTNDAGAIAFWEMMSIYDVRGDVNLDGSVTSADSAAATTESLGWEVLSGIDSRKGYAGYEHAPELAGTTQHIRRRANKADLGRWLQRDPLGYVEGANLYEYGRSQPNTRRDPSGLDSSICVGGGCSPSYTPPPPQSPAPPPIICASGSCNPAAAQGWLEVLIFNLMNQGYTTAQIAQILRSLGVNVLIIAKVLDLTVDHVDRITDGERCDQLHAQHKRCEKLVRSCNKKMSCTELAINARGNHLCIRARQRYVRECVHPAARQLWRRGPGYIEQMNNRLGAAARCRSIATDKKCPWVTELPWEPPTVPPNIILVGTAPAGSPSGSGFDSGSTLPECNED